MKSLVSIIIPSYNRGKSIARAVQSVLDQTYANVEVIVVDDCSTDDTPAIMKSKFANENKVIFHRLKNNSGACVARNTGVKLSHGKFIGFLDSDDVFLPKKLDKQLALLESTGASLCATDYLYVDENGEEKVIQVHPNNMDRVYKDLLYCNFITTGTLIGMRECFLEMAFDETLPRYQDWDLVLRLSQKYTMCFLREITLVQYCEPVSISKSTNHGKTLSALETIYEKNREGYANDRRAYTQINWLMGVHSLFVNKKRNYRRLWMGVVHDGFKMHRFLGFLAALAGYLKPIDNSI